MDIKRKSVEVNVEEFKDPGSISINISPYKRTQKTSRDSSIIQECEAGCRVKKKKNNLRKRKCSSKQYKSPCGFSSRSRQ